MWKKEELGKSFGSRCLFFFLRNRKKGEWWNYTVKQRPQTWAKMEYNLFCEMLISNKIGKIEIRNVFENIKLCY